MMDDENEEVVKKFPGLYNQESNAYRSDSECDSSSERGNKKELLKQKKEKVRDIGYAALDAESSAEEMDIFDSKSSTKGKKSKSFKFLKKKEKDDKEKKREEKDDKLKDKKKEKEIKKKEKEQKRRSKKDKKKRLINEEEEGAPIFGVALSLAVERCPSHDGIKIPAIVRCCIDFVEENGLTCEGIYRIGGVKNKVQSLKRAFNCGELVPLNDQQPHVVASLLKLFLRELPETVLTVDMMPHFEDVSLIPNPKERAGALRQLIDRLPTINRLLLQYMLKHMGHVVEHEVETKMSYQNVCVVLSPTMQISHRVLNVMFHSHKYLFGNVHIKKYIPPIMSSSSTSHRSVDELYSPNLIEEELYKQESLLASLHSAVAGGKVSHKTEEQLWEAQRIHTLLKRRLKMNEKKGEESSGGQDSSLEKLNSESSGKELSRNSSSEKNETEQDNQDEQNEKPNPYKGDHHPANPPSHVIIDNGSKDTTENVKTPPSVLKTETMKQLRHPIPVLPKPTSGRLMRNKLTQESKEAPDHNVLPFVNKINQPIVTLGVKNELKNAKDDSNVLERTDAVIIPKETTNSSLIPTQNCSRNISESDLEILRKEELRLQYEHEECLASNQRLMMKLKSEKTEISRLKEEIQEMQTIYGYRTHSYDSSESEGSDSDGESDTEEDIIAQISTIEKINEQVKNDNLSLVSKIQKEREAVIKLRVSLRENKFRTNLVAAAS